MATQKKKAAKKAGTPKATKAAAAAPVAAEAPAGPKRFVPKGKAGAGRTAGAPAQTATAEQSGNGAAAPANGTRAFLIGVFAEPSTVDAAAARLRLEQPVELDADGAAKKVRAFLEDTATDPAYDVRKKGDGDGTLFLVKAVPVEARRTASPTRRGEMKKETRKKPGKKTTSETSGAKPRGEKPKSVGVQAFMLSTITSKFLSKEAILDACEKHFPDRGREAMGRTFGVTVGGNHVRCPKHWKITSKKENGSVLFHAERTEKKA